MPRSLNEDTGGRFRTFPVGAGCGGGRSDIKRQRLGRKLMEKIVRYCRSRGTRQIVGHFLCDNKRMFVLIRSLGFESKKVLDENIMEVVVDLQQPLRQPDA